MKSKIIIILIIIFIALVLTSGIIWFIYNYDISDNHRQTMVKINKDTTIIWEFKDELPDTLSVYTTTPREDNELFDHILDYCGFPKLNYFPGTSFSNDSWRLRVEDDGTISCQRTNWRIAGEEKPHLPYNEAEATARNFIEEQLKLDNAAYHSLGPTLGDDVPYFLLFSYLFDGKYASEFPVILSIGLHSEDVVDLRISHRETNKIGNIKTISLQEIMRNISDLDWYVIAGNLTTKEQIYTLVINDIGITYFLEDGLYIPYVSLFGVASNASNSASVTSEYIRAYTGPINELTDNESHVVTERIVTATETNNGNTHEKE